MAKRLIALFLALLMASAMPACGSDEQQSNDTTPTTDGDTTAPEDDNTLKSGVPEGTTFGGQPVRILNGCYWDKYHYLMNSPEITGEVISNAVYFRNLAVEDRLDITLEITNAQESNRTSYQVTDTLTKSVNAGDQDYDIYQGVEAFTPSYPLQGLVYDFKDTEYISFDAPWWSTKWIENAHIGSDKRFFVTGDISLLHIMQLSVIFFNKSLIEDYYGDGNLLYKEVLDGTWTLDRLYELSSGIWDDSNGNDKIDIQDTVGITHPAKSFNTIHLFYGAGGRDTYYDDDGVIQIMGTNEREADIIEKIYKLVWNNPGNFDPAYITSSYETEFPGKYFTQGNIAFMANYLYASDALRDMKDAYGIIPNPKLDETIENYTNVIHDQNPVFFIPAVTSTADIACATLEEMAFEGYMNMTPQYYEIALKRKYMRDDQDDAMKIMDIIRDSATSEPAFSLSLSNRLIVYSCVGDAYPNYASMHATYYTSSVAKLNDFKELYLD